MSIVALQSFLEPIRHFLDDPNLEEIIVNRPGEVFVENAGVFSRYVVPELSIKRLLDVAALIATFSNQNVSEETPLLSAILPEGHRVQVVMPPACPADMFGIAIRKPSTRDFGLSDYEQSGAFKPCLRNADVRAKPVDYELAQLLRSERIADFLKLAIQSRKNIIISGGTSSGKTTLLKSFIKEINLDERILTIEDVQELFIPQQNKLHLLASRGEQGKAQVTVQSLLEACLRLRPDRIMLGELRGAEAFFFLRAINTGHPGSISSLHADTPDLCFEQLCMLVLQASIGLSRSEILDYVKSIIDIVIQFNRFHDGFRGMSDIYFRHRDLSHEH